MGCASGKAAYATGDGARPNRVLSLERKGSWFSNVLKSAAKEKPKTDSSGAAGGGAAAGNGASGGGGSAKVAVTADG